MKIFKVFYPIVVVVTTVLMILSLSTMYFTALGFLLVVFMLVINIISAILIMAESNGRTTAIISGIFLIFICLVIMIVSLFSLLNYVKIYSNIEVTNMNSLPNLEAYENSNEGEEKIVSISDEEKELTVGYNDDQIVPGLYTIEISQIKDDNMYNFFTPEISLQIGTSNFETKFRGLFFDDETFENISLNEDDKLYLESDKNFEIKLTPQSEYNDLEYDALKPGIYLAGKTIDEGKYTYKIEEDSSICVQSTIDYSESCYYDDGQLQIEEGDVIVTYVFEYGDNELIKKNNIF